MILNVKNLKRLKKQATPLEKTAINYVLDRWSEYDNKEDIFTEVLHYGCKNGAVCFLIYTDDCVKFYKKHQVEIGNLLKEIVQETGIYNLKELFRDWDNNDIFAKSDYNQNILAWFGFEEALRNLALKFEELEGKI